MMMAFRCAPVTKCLADKKIYMQKKKKQQRRMTQNRMIVCLCVSVEEMATEFQRAETIKFLISKKILGKH